MGFYVQFLLNPVIATINSLRVRLNRLMKRCSMLNLGIILFFLGGCSQVAQLT